MGRKRKGWIRQRGESWYFGLTLRDGSPYEEKVVGPTGVPITETTADKVRAARLDDYDRGVWDPKITQPPKPTPQPKTLTVYEYALKWIDQQVYETADSERKVIKRWFKKSSLANIQLSEFTTLEALEYLRWLQHQPSQFGGILAPRSVRYAFGILKRVLDEAVLVGVLPANPCTTVSKKLPSIEDKDPTARETWTFTHANIHALCSNERLPLVDRVFNALRFFTGARFGELAVLRWSDIDYNTQPLPRLTIRRARKTVSKREGRTKTGARKEVPVHPQLQPILALWRKELALHLGRLVNDSDLILPVLRKRPSKSDFRDDANSNKVFKNNCKTLGIPVKHQHTTRHAFISLVQDDGADGSVIRWITHAPPSSAFDGYTRTQWGRLCTEMLKYKATLNIPADILETPPSNDLTAIIPEDNYCDLAVGKNNSKDIASRDTSPFGDLRPSDQSLRRDTEADLLAPARIFQDEHLYGVVDQWWHRFLLDNEAN